MKVLADECVDREFVAVLKDILSGEGVTLESVHSMRWLETKNGKLQELCRKRDFQLMVSDDKQMAWDTKALVPVLLFDKVTPKRVIVCAETAAKVITEYDLREPDYYPVMVRRLTPTPTLRSVAVGAYKYNPRVDFSGRGYLKAPDDNRDPSAPERNRNEKSHIAAMRFQRGAHTGPR